MGAPIKSTRKPAPKPSVSRRSIIALMLAPAMEHASRLDREADVALSHGHHTRAERLAWRAAELRGWA